MCHAVGKVSSYIPAKLPSVGPRFLHCSGSSCSTRRFAFLDLTQQLRTRYGCLLCCHGFWALGPPPAVILWLVVTDHLPPRRVGCPIRRTDDTPHVCIPFEGEERRRPTREPLDLPALSLGPLSHRGTRHGDCAPLEALARICRLSGGVGRTGFVLTPNPVFDVGFPPTWAPNMRCLSVPGASLSLVTPRPPSRTAVRSTLPCGVDGDRASHCRDVAPWQGTG